MVMTKEERKEYNRLYHLKNQEKLNEKQRLYRLNNKEKIKEYNLKNQEKIKEWRKSPTGIKSYTIGNWRANGLIDQFNDNYESIYERYLTSTNCEECNCEYGIYGDGGGRSKDMDHCHKTNLFRNILCHTCNLRRR